METRLKKYNIDPLAELILNLLAHSSTTLAVTVRLSEVDLIIYKIIPPTGNIDIGRFKIQMLGRLNV